MKTAVSSCSWPLLTLFLKEETSGTQQRKFHADDVSQCLHNKSGSPWVPSTKLFNLHLQSYISPGRF